MKCETTKKQKNQPIGCVRHYARKGTASLCGFAHRNPPPFMLIPATVRPSNVSCKMYPKSRKIAQNPQKLPPRPDDVTTTARTEIGEKGAADSAGLARVRHRATSTP